MLFRRITKHVREQNWFAVGIDFCIVVIGVFIGIQVANWNDTRSTKEDYRLAKLRLVAEIDDNINRMNVTQEELDNVIPRVSQGIDALRECQTGREAERLVVDAIRELQLTRGHKFTMSTLKDLTEDKALLGQQSEQERRAFRALSNTIEQLQFEADFFEMKPLDEPIWRYPTLKRSAAREEDATYRGVSWQYIERDLSLSAPVGESCKDTKLIASLYEYERLQSALSALFIIATTELISVRVMIVGEERETE